MARVRMIMIMVLGLLAVTVQASIQDTILKMPAAEFFNFNAESAAYGLVTTSQNSEKALNDTSIFTVESSVEILGRKFVLGKIMGANVVYVNSANRPQAHVGMTVQIMADHFKLRGVILFGSAGGINNSVNVGDVVVPKSIGNNGIWTWQQHGSTASNVDLVFGEFNSPNEGDNLLGSVAVSPSQVYQRGKLLENKFWIRADAGWLATASKIEFAATQDNCGNPSKLDCLGAAKNKVVVGVKAASSDIIVNNYEYREFLWHHYKVSTVDTSSHSFGLAAYTNDLKLIVFRGVSNTAGASDEHNSRLANMNAVKAIYRFIKLDLYPRADNQVVYEDDSETED